jgi:hypothetical protein
MKYLLFYDVWYGTSLMHEHVQGSSSCREDRGSHYSSHDSRRRYLLDAYLEKRPIFEERAQKHNLGERWSQGEYV